MSELPLAEKVELIGCAWEARWIMFCDAVEILTEESHGGLTRVGAAEWLIRWGDSRSSWMRGDK